MTRATTKTPQGMDPNEVSNFCVSLEEAEQSANGYGTLKSAVIEADLSGTRAIGTYEDGRWTVAFES